MNWPLTSAIAAGVTAFVGSFCYGAFWPRSRLFAPVVCRGEAGHGKRIALTFDDGPHPEATPALLDVLAAHDVKAAFFVIGANAARHPDVLRRMDAAGHILGNHSYDHDYLGMFRLHRYWADQLARTDDAIVEAVGKRPTMFRPPMGFKQIFIGETVRRRGYTMVTWTRRAFDGWPISTERILSRLVEPARAGEILTLHDGADAHTNERRDLMRTVHAVGPLIEGLRGRGFELVRLDELIDVKPYRDVD